MFTNRIRHYFKERLSARKRQTSNTGFAVLPPFAGSHLAGICTSQNSMDVYRIAFEQAQLQVARRREIRRRAAELN